jgi:hypothetical protein
MMNININLVVMLIVGVVLIVFHVPFSQKLHSALPLQSEREARSKRTGCLFLAMGTLLVILSLLTMFLPGSGS